MALMCLLEYQREMWPSHLKVLYVAILWLLHSSGEGISYLKLLSQFLAHSSNRNQFFTSSSASKSRSIHFIFRYFKNFLLNSLSFFLSFLPALQKSLLLQWISAGNIRRFPSLFNSILLKFNGLASHSVHNILTEEKWSPNTTIRFFPRPTSLLSQLLRSIFRGRKTAGKRPFSIIHP